MIYLTFIVKIFKMFKFIFSIISIILFIQIINSKNITWTGNNNIYWDNSLNWDPQQIPTYNDNVFIPINSSVPPYSDKIIYANKLNIQLMLDLYGTTAYIHYLENNGLLNLYRSAMIIDNPTDLNGQIKLAESMIYVPLLTLSNKYSVISGTGDIRGMVYNEKGTIRIESGHILTFLEYKQSINGSLLYYLGNNLIIANYAELKGNIYVSLYDLYKDRQIIFKSLDIAMQNVSLNILNNNSSGNLTIEYIDNSALLVVYLQRE